MLERPLLQRLLLAPPTLRSSLLTSPRRSLSFQLQGSAAYSSNLQSVTQPSFWRGLVPKPLRKAGGKKVVKTTGPKGWNPATFYIWIFLLIGSMSIQMIALKNQHSTFMRRADAKLDLLKEIIERIQKGEKVDVEGLLGTGNKQQEQEWEEVLKDIEREEELWNEARKRPVRSKDAVLDPQVEDTASDSQKTETKVEVVANKIKSNAPRGFY